MKQKSSIRWYAVFSNRPYVIFKVIIHYSSNASAIAACFGVRFETTMTWYLHNMMHESCIYSNSCQVHRLTTRENLTKCWRTSISSRLYILETLIFKSNVLQILHSSLFTERYSRKYEHLKIFIKIFQSQHLWMGLLSSNQISVFIS